MSERKRSGPRIAVLGYIVRGPIGGLAWHHLQYVLGLHKMGFDVLFIEDSDDYPACYDPVSNQLTTDPGYGLKFIDESFRTVGLDDLWAYYDAHSNKWFGKRQAAEFIASADILLNLSGMNPLRDWADRVPTRVFVDTDPAFVQIRHLTDANARELAARHNVFFSFGERFGTSDCRIPDDGFAWQPTRQPVVLEAWPVTPGNQNGSWTTIMQWDSYRAVEYGGVRFGMKSESFTRILDLPKRSGESFEAGIGSATVPLELLGQNGWQVINPLGPTKSVMSYQAFISGSKAEFSVAKHGYVTSRSGWFSERSAAYLASGRPVLTQETGFSEVISTGEGLLSYTNPEEALAGIDEINRDYRFHCRRARQIAAEYFDHRKVLGDLLARITG